MQRTDSSDKNATTSTSINGVAGSSVQQRNEGPSEIRKKDTMGNNGILFCFDDFVFVVCLVLAREREVGTTCWYNG